jgi:hypothetical protein
MSHKSHFGQHPGKHTPRQRLEPCVRELRSRKLLPTCRTRQSLTAPTTGASAFTNVTTYAGILTTVANVLNQEPGLVTFADSSYHDEGNGSFSGSDQEVIMPANPGTCYNPVVSCSSRTIGRSERALILLPMLSSAFMCSIKGP